MIDQSGWPAHLRDDAPYLVCDVCGRKSWGSEVAQRCDMPQPNGKPCHGHFQPAQQTGDGDDA